jgi:predicted amidohydrolase
MNRDLNGKSRTDPRISAGRAARFRICAALATALVGTAVPPCAAGPNGARYDQPPRKVLIATVVSGYEINSQPLEQRFDRMGRIVDEAEAKAAVQFPGRRLDLVVFPEYLFARPGGSLREQAVRLDDILPRIDDRARRSRCYIVAPAILVEENGVKFSNAALLVDRSGSLAGIYRKVHPVAPQGSAVLEGGITPGRGFPVFSCDFGRVGIQICFDLLYPDGWASLARQGAEIVVLPTASPESTRPCAYALAHEYYIVSSAPRDHAAVYSPLGLIEVEATHKGEVLVHEIDLSFAILHWEAELDEGRALTRRFGERVGYRYHRSEDKGIFWSNDPTMPLGRMLTEIRMLDSDANAERLRLIQDKARGSPPVAR